MFIVEYAGFKAQVTKYDDVYYGTVLDIPDIITFQTKDEDKIMKEFIISTDVYLDFCKNYREKHRR